MSIENFVSAYSGSLEDQIRNMLKAQIIGTITSDNLADLWSKFLTDRNITSGTLGDRIKQFLISLNNQPGTTETTNDLWKRVTSPIGASGGKVLKAPLIYGTGAGLTNITVDTATGTINFVAGADHGDIWVATSEKLVGNYTISFTITNLVGTAPAYRVGATTWSGAFFSAVNGANSVVRASQGNAPRLWFGWAGAATDRFTISNIQVTKA